LHMNWEIFFQVYACTHFVLRQKRALQENDALNTTWNTEIYSPNTGDLSMSLA
jgi:hypothetical protein